MNRSNIEDIFSWMPRIKPGAAGWEAQTLPRWLHRPQLLQVFKTVYPVPVEEETEDAGRVFDFLFRNVQEVSPPSDLNLNDPNLIRQQQQDQQGGVYYKPVEQVSQLLLDKVF